MDLHYLAFLLIGVQLLGSVRPQGNSLDCSRVHCARPPTCDPGFAPIIPVGACCPICLPAVTPGPPIATGPFGCEGVECEETNCPPDAIPLVPIGHCCPVCQPAPSYTTPTYASTTTGSTVTTQQVSTTHMHATQEPTAATDVTPQQANTTDSGTLDCRAIPIAGMVYSDCASVCPRSCGSPFHDSCNVCQPGCQCPKGQVIDVRRMRCVPVHECPGQNIECPVVGQILQLCPPCPVQTCQQIVSGIKPRESCFATCRPACACLPGHVIDEASNRCVLQQDCPGIATTQPSTTITETVPSATTTTERTAPTVTTEVTTGTSEPLACPPVCSKQFCSGRGGGNRLCTVPGAGSCGGQCRLTYCRACYYSPVTRTLPANITCGNCNNYSIRNQCFLNWARCVRRTDRLLNGNLRVRKGDRVPANFRCYAPPCLV